MNAFYFALRNRLRGRKSHTYCVGAAKTGTTALARVMSQAMRSAHEPLVTKTNDLVISYLTKEISNATLYRELKRRDSQLYLEFESSHQLGYLAPALSEIFPDSNFLITLREPKKWLKSRLNFHFEKKPKEWKKYRSFIWNRHKQPYSKHEKILEEKGLFPISTYLAQYAEQYCTIFDNVDSGRVLTIETELIDDSLPQIASFTNIADFQLTPVRANELKLSKNIIDDLPPEFVDEQVEKFTRSLVNYI